MNIYKFCLVLLCTIVLIVSCKSDDDQQNNYDSVGLIIGLDTAQCACCGNWIIQIDNEQNPHQFLSLPDDSEIDLENADFPISVRLNWTESSESCELAIITEIVED